MEPEIAQAIVVGITTVEAIVWMIAFMRLVRLSRNQASPDRRLA